MAVRRSSTREDRSVYTIQDHSGAVRFLNTNAVGCASNAGMKDQQLALWSSYADQYRQSRWRFQCYHDIRGKCRYDVRPLSHVVTAVERYIHSLCVRTLNEVLGWNVLPGSARCMRVHSFSGNYQKWSFFTGFARKSVGGIATPIPAIVGFTDQEGVVTLLGRYSRNV